MKIKVGDVFSLLDLEWRVIKISKNSCLCLAESIKYMSFVVDNNWKKSNIREYLNGEFYKNLVAVIGAENILPMKRNLIALNGQTEYGTCIDNVSIISLDEYRKYRNRIPICNYWWWTLTPDSTTDNCKCVRLVSNKGGIGTNGFRSEFSVRPFVSFSIEIFDSDLIKKVNKNK